MTNTIQREQALAAANRLDAVSWTDPEYHRIRADVRTIRTALMVPEMPSDLAEIQARVDAATPGPWKHDGSGDVEDVPEFVLDRFDIMPQTIARADLRNEDAEFIAHARTDVPMLVAALVAAQDRIRELEEKR
jgi:hypothetical protein